MLKYFPLLGQVSGPSHAIMGRGMLKVVLLSVPRLRADTHYFEQPPRLRAVDPSIDAEAREEANQQL